ncbi:MAG TPA: protein-L-isoaspartate(D-aspartate) O-methyltransferase [Candidatus Bathyarchaeota archaeon]|nr:protein-L-isoaspartate(D-aspartate) O-methyltransferase [Candidatus Bathyarchaeota archaeon]
MNTPTYLLEASPLSENRLREAWELLVQRLVRQHILRSKEVIEAFRRAPRYNFLPEELRQYAAIDEPIPIGYGQTVSAPHMVAIMDEELELKVGQKVLEVGAGSGWHAATVAELVAPTDQPKESWGHVYTIEIVPELAQMAKINIEKNGYSDRVTVIEGDGSLGYEEKAPYDRILVTAAAPEVPKPLIQQLKTGGILLIPVGAIRFYQTLIKVRKEDGIRMEDLGGVAFVPLRGKYGHKML